MNWSLFIREKDHFSEKNSNGKSFHENGKYLNTMHIFFESKRSFEHRIRYSWNRVIIYNASVPINIP